MINQLRGSGDIQQAALTMLQNNPNGQQVMQMIRAGRSPKDLALSMMQQRGINPQDILSKIR